MQRGTFQLMKSVNKSIILNKIRKSGPISRAQIAKETELTPPTVSSIVRELVLDNMVTESSSSLSKGGRKPTMLTINDNAHLIISVDAGPNTVKYVITNLAGKIMDRYKRILHPPLTKETFLDSIITGIRHLLDRSVNNNHLVGIGVAMHGVVDVENGISLVAPNLDLHDIFIKKELEAEFQIPVKVDNDARVMALGESWFGHHGQVKSMVFVNAGNGVGSGFVIDGKLYHGSQDIAGEIGHMTMDIHGTPCSCGNKGCLQTFATGSAIAKRAGRESGERVYQAALSGDLQCIDILHETGVMIGVALTNLIHILNPELIVLGGGVLNAEKFILPAVRETIANRALTKSAQKTAVIKTKIGEDAALLGAAALFLDDIFQKI